MIYYTIVQHSAYGYNDDETFKAGLELRSITTKMEFNRIQRLGGILFDNYSEASDYAYKEMYPNDVKGLIPQARGEFLENEIDGLKLYRPIKKLVWSD